MSAFSTATASTGVGVFIKYPVRAAPEMMRRLRLGDVLKVLRCRYGHTLPDDDAGRDDLRELLLPISLGAEAGRKMENAIEIWAPWMSTDEARRRVDEINRTPPYLRTPTARDLGQRLGLTWKERQSWGIRTIAPCDLTEEELAQRRKLRKEYRRWLRRRRAGGKTRNEYLVANSISRTKPWEAEGISRPQWYRRRAKRHESLILLAHQPTCEPFAIMLLLGSHAISYLLTISQLEL